MCKHAFTLIEIIVVIGILALLIGLSLGAYKAFSQQARDNKRKADLLLVRSAVEMYHSQNSVYPATGELDFACAHTARLTDAAQSHPAINTYMQSLPHDPQCPQLQYGYLQLTTGYLLGAKIAGSVPANNICAAALACGASTCNYCLSPNQ